MGDWQAAWEANKDRLAELVHNAWMKAKIGQGFADHPIEKKPVYNKNFTDTIDYFVCARCSRSSDKHHPDTLPFAELSDAIKTYDYETALVVFPMAYDIGYADSEADCPANKTPGPCPPGCKER